MRVLSDLDWLLWGMLSIFVVFYSYTLMLTTEGWTANVGAITGGVMVGILTSLAVRHLIIIDEQKSKLNTMEERYGNEK